MGPMRKVHNCSGVVSGLGWVPCKGGRGGGGRCARSKGCGRRRRRQQRGWGLCVFALPFGGRGAHTTSRGSAGTCVSVLSCSPCVWGGIFARPEATAVRIRILHVRLLSIKFPNLLGCRGSQQCVGGPRLLQLLCPLLLGGLCPCALIEREVFPISKRTLGSL